jgi:transcriptional regulator with XRE-family HTH domain
MKHKKEPPLLRMHRRTWGLTLRELARLLGLRSGTHVSRLEQGKRRPTLETALACTALFGVPLAELFPQLVNDMDRRFHARANAFRKGLGQRTTQSAARKCELLDLAGLSEEGTETTIEA